MNGEPLLTAAQLDHLRRLVEADDRGLIISNRNAPGALAGPTFEHLRRAGLAELVCEPRRRACATHAGRRAVSANAEHLPPPLHATEPYRRGLQQAADVRHTAVRELTALVADEETKPVRDRKPGALAFARAQLERFHEVNRREGGT